MAIVTCSWCLFYGTLSVGILSLVSEQLISIPTCAHCSIEPPQIYKKPHKIKNLHVREHHLHVGENRKIIIEKTKRTKK